MALIKLGSIVTDLSGSAGGSTVQNSRAGFILRNKPQQVFSRTSSQYSIRSINTALHAGWKALTDQQRSVWAFYAKTKPVFNISGDKHPLSGHSLWLKYQYGRLIEELPFLTHPDQYLDNYLGPEKIPYPDFSNPAGWDLNPESSIHDNALYLLSTSPGNEFCYFNLSVLSNTESYRVQIQTEFKLGNLYWGNGHSPWSICQNGLVTYIYYPNTTAPSFYFFLFTPSSATIRYLSIKLILT